MNRYNYQSTPKALPFLVGDKVKVTHPRYSNYMGIVTEASLSFVSVMFPDYPPRVLSGGIQRVWGSPEEDCFHSSIVYKVT